MVTPTDLPLLTGASLAASSSVTAPDSIRDTRLSRAVPSSGFSRSSLSGTGNPCAGADVGVIVGVDVGVEIGVSVAVAVGVGVIVDAGVAAATGAVPFCFG